MEKKYIQSDLMDIRDQFDPDLRKIIKKKKPTAVIAIGSIEQHGPHLPISTDSDIVTEIATKLTKRINGISTPYNQLWNFR